MKLRCARALLLTTIGLAWSVPSYAHWCHDLWAVRYSIVVRPTSDTINVPPTGSVDLPLDVENNMGYPLLGFQLSATATDFTISVSRETPKISNYLMPGEKLRHFLSISRSGSASVFAIEDVRFYIMFGNGVQDDQYGPNGTGVVVKKTTGDIVPTRPVPNLTNGNGQALHLRNSNRANYGDLAQAISYLLAEYCAGRGSYGAGDGDPITTYCPNETTTVCPAAVSRDATKYDWQHLWAAGELAYRKTTLTTAQQSTFRERLVCGWEDSYLGFQAFTGVILGYLGEDATARTFLEGKVQTGNTDEQNIAQAALFLMGDTQRRQTVQSCLNAGNEYVEMACAAALGIADGDDTAVEDELLTRARWVCPTRDCLPSPYDDGLGLTGAHLVNLVAWDRRGWAIDANDTGVVSFFNALPDTVPPQPPSAVSCSIVGQNIRLQWNQVTLDENNNPETVSTYRVYWGETANSCPTCVRPGMGFDYDHVDATTAIFFEPSPLDAGDTYYLTVTAVDAASNQSVFSTEVSCVAPVPAQPPVAVISCDRTSGAAPLTVTCDGSASSDPNNDIDHYYFSLDGQPETENTQETYVLTAPGPHQVALRVVDSAALEDTDQEAIIVSDATAPTILHTPISDGQPATTDVTVTTIVTDLSGIATVEIYYRAAGAGSFTMGAMANAGGDTYQADIPAASVTTAGVEYYLIAVDSSTSANAGVDPAGGAAAPHAFTVTVGDTSGPAITHSPIADDQRIGIDVAVTATITDPSGVDSATLHFRPNGGSFSTQTMTDLGGGLFGAAIPGATVQQPSVDYYLSSTDTVGNASELPVQGATAPLTFTVIGNRPPSAAATANPTSGNAPLAVSFSSASSSDPDGDNLSYAWDFADGTATSIDPNPTHEFQAGGIFDVTLTVTDDGTPAENDTATVRIDVTDPSNSPPDLTAVSVTPLFGPPPLDVRFDASGVFDPDGDNFSRDWAFGDGGSDSGPLVDHTYQQAGTFTAVLSSQDDGQPQIPPATRSFQIEVQTANHAPSASGATVSPLQGEAPLDITMDATGASDPDDDSLIYAWTITAGVDEIFSTTSSVARTTLTSSGLHEVTLVVTDNGSPALQASRAFEVDVTEGGSGGGNGIAGPGVSGDCSCTTTHRSSSWPVWTLFR